MKQEQMNIKQRARTIAESQLESDYIQEVIVRCCIIMATKQDQISRADERKMVIEKATLWLHKNWRKYVSTDRDGTLAFRGWKEEFKQAMEE